MAKSREKIQQIGFWDAEVSNQNHDEICLWAYKNSEQIAHKINPEIFDRSWSEEDIFDKDLTLQERKSLDKFLLENPRPKPKISQKQLEYVLFSYSGYQNANKKIVGYADLFFEVSVPMIFKKYNPAQNDEKSTDFEIDGNGQKSFRVLVEVKSKLPTLGELMRQIQLYKTTFSGAFVVICPNDEYADILKEHGIYFIKHDTKNICI